MTPKEKAVELVEIFTFRCFECDYENNAKQSSLKAIDLLFEETESLNVRYWNKVKKEIEKL